MTLGKKGTLIVLLTPLLSLVGYATPQRSAEILNREVRHELVMLPTYTIFDNLEYRVDGNKVVLQGQVTKPTLRSDAEQAVKRAEGITTVTNNIEVLPLSPADDEIRLKVYYALFGRSSSVMRYGMGSVPPIHIIVKNGNIRLVGEVDNEGDKVSAGMLASHVDGAFGVTNDLKVTH